VVSYRYTENADVYESDRFQHEGLAYMQMNRKPLLILTI
jgi:hypothetical protein